MADAATTVTVSTTSDTPTSGQCSLREAVAYADGTAEPGCAPGTTTPPTTIKLPAGTYTLTGSGLSITAATTINGAAASKTTISGGNAVQPISIASTAVVTLNGVTVTDGLSGVPTTGCTGSGITLSCPAENGNNGGGIANAGTLAVVDSVITGNRASDGTLPFSRVQLVCFGANCPGHAGETGGGGGDGGGIANAGTLTIEDTTISDNTAGAGANGTNGVSGTGTDVGAGEDGGSGGEGGTGGGIYSNGGMITITDSSLTGNHAGAGGNGGAASSADNASGDGGTAGYPGEGGSGGGYYGFGSAVITGSTLAGNVTGAGADGAAGGAATGTGANGESTYSTGGGAGGGAWLFSPSGSQLINDTITQNRAAAGGTGGAGAGVGGFGGGIVGEDGLVQVSFTTIADNVALGEGGGIGAGSAFTLAGSIVASNTGVTYNNCVGTITDDGHNVVFGDNSCPGTNVNPQLGPLADNGGPTQTLALKGGSGAIDLVPLNDCPVATDQRGVTRPQGARCDAGAYEFAPPQLTAPAASAGQTSGTVSAAINPNLRDTKVLVHYGPTTAYGSSTDARDIGAANTDTRISIPVSGLRRGRTYHAEIIATNGDGTTTSGDLTFTTGTSAALVRGSSKASTKGGRLKLTIACRSAAGGRCAGPITVTAHVTKRSGKPVAVASVLKPRPVKTLVVIARGHYSIPGASTRTITIKLNATGRKLLRRFHHLPATLTVSGIASPTRRIVFTTAKKQHKRRHKH